jgi:hypothetical protein
MALNAIQMVVRFMIGIVTLSTLAQVVDRRQFSQLAQFAKGIVDRRSRDVRHNREDALVDLLGSRVTVVCDKQLENHPSLRGDFKPVLPEQVEKQPE